jgi:purine-binding chemotaxis protein CheW
LTFRLSGQQFGIWLNRVRESVPMASLSRPPGMPPILAGFLNLCGAAVSVLRLDRLLGLAPCESGMYATLLVLRTPDNPAALLVDGVTGIINCAPESLVPVSVEMSFNGCAEAEMSVDGQRILVLSLDQILLERERKTITHFLEIEQKRLTDLEVAQP